VLTAIQSSKGDIQWLVTAEIRPNQRLVVSEYNVGRFLITRYEICDDYCKEQSQFVVTIDESITLTIAA